MPRLPRAPYVTPLLLLLLTVVAYGPVLVHGGFVWDDPDYVLNNRLLRTAAGLWSIWTSPSSLPQYYPLVHTTYWFEYRLVGASPHLYHVTNVLLHAGSCWLLYGVLRRLEVPGALLAACLFASHPVMVESVAWVTERKNTLSMVFYLGAFLTYWRFCDEAPPRNWRWFAASLALFVCALLSKTVTCSLPAALLLVLWWKGRLCRRTVGPLVPFFVVGAELAVYTAYLERTHVGASGREFDLGVAERMLIAPRAVLFYAGKLLWPAPLSFIYPRWRLDPHSWIQWAPLAGCVAITAGLVVLAVRRGRRGPLVAWLVFAGTLVPALGFFNVYPMRYSFVADHFQYHAAPALLALFAAWLTVALGRRASVAYALLVPLAVGTMVRGGVYESARALWTDTVAKNPDAWMPQVNLGHALVDAGDLDGAERHYRRAVEVAPEQPETLHNLGGILAKRGRYDEAMAEYRRALVVDPKYPGALFGMGSALLAKGDAAGAVPWLRRAIAVYGEYAQAHYTLGRAYERLGEAEAARAEYEAAVAADPDDAESLYNLGTLYLKFGHAGDAAECFRRAVAVRPGRADFHANLGAAYLQLNRPDAALAEYATAARLDPELGVRLRAFLAERGLRLPER